MPIIRTPPPKTRHYPYLKWLQPKTFSSSTSPPPTETQISSLILDQNSAAEALDTFRWASGLRNFRHTQATYRALIQKLSSLRRFDAAKEILYEIPTSLGSPPDDATFVSLVRSLGRAGLFRRALQIPDLAARLRGGSPPSLKILNSVLDVLVEVNIDLARDFFRNTMAAAGGVHGDQYTFAILMKGLCSANRISQAFKLLQLMKSSSSPGPNTVIYNTLLHALCRNGGVGRARSLMNEMDQPSEVTFNIMISAYCTNNENLVQALVMLEKCYSLSLLPDVIAITKILESLCSSGRVSEAVEVLERFESRGGKPDAVCHNAVIRGFCGSGKPGGGSRLMREMERKGCLPNTDTYNLMISGFCGSGKLASAAEIFREMESVGVRRNLETYEALIKGLCTGGDLEEGFRILRLMEETKEGSGGRIGPYNWILYGLYISNRWDEGVEFLTQMERLFPRAVSRNLAIFELCDRGEINEAKSVYDRTVGEGGAPSAFVYSLLIRGLCGDRRLREALELTNEMISQGYSPAASTLSSVISGFCSEGKLGVAARLVEDMVQRGCKLDGESFGPVLRGLCREGDFAKGTKVFSLMAETGVVPDCSSWDELTRCLSREPRWLDNAKEKLECVIGV